MNDIHPLMRIAHQEYEKLNLVPEHRFKETMDLLEADIPRSKTIIAQIRVRIKEIPCLVSVPEFRQMYETLKDIYTSCFAGLSTYQSIGWPEAAKVYGQIRYGKAMEGLLQVQQMAADTLIFSLISHSHQIFPEPPNPQQFFGGQRG